MNQDIRWQQRFQNYAKAFALLRAVIKEKPVLSLSDLEKEGLIKRFEFTLELAWKTLKDKMQEDGIWPPKTIEEADILLGRKKTAKKKTAKKKTAKKKVKKKTKAAAKK